MSGLNVLLGLIGLAAIILVAIALGLIALDDSFKD